MNAPKKAKVGAVLLTASALFCVEGVSAQTPGSAAPPPIGRHGFDFEFGRWLGARAEHADRGAGASVLRRARSRTRRRA